MREFPLQSSGQALRWSFKLGDRTQEMITDAAIVTDVSDAVAAVLAAGGGIGISPTFVAAPYVARGLLVPLLQGYFAPRSAITALWPEGRRASPNVKAFLGFLTDIFPRDPPWDAVLRANGA